MDYANTTEIIASTGALPEADIAFVRDNINKIQDNWEKKQKWRTELEARVSVLNDVKFPTPASKYWQSVREQSVFYENLVQESFEFRRIDLKIKKIGRDMSEATDELELEGLQIDLEEANFHRLNAIQACKDRMREIRMWDMLIDEQVAADPTFNTEDVNDHQNVSYMERWHNQMVGLKEGNSSVSEVNNLLGQYVSVLRLNLERYGSLPDFAHRDAIELGVIPKLAPSEVTNISTSYKLEG